jgi:DNA primase
VVTEKPDLLTVWEHYGGQVVRMNLYGWAPSKCPLHDDSHASAQVHEEKQVWRCMVCDLFGDVYNLVMHKEGIGFREAKHRAAEIAGAAGTRVSGSDGRGHGLLPRRPQHRPERRRYVPPWARS